MLAIERGDALAGRGEVVGDPVELVLGLGDLRRRATTCEVLSRAMQRLLVRDLLLAGPSAAAGRARARHPGPARARPRARPISPMRKGTARRATRRRRRRSVRDRGKRCGDVGAGQRRWRPQFVRAWIVSRAVRGPSCDGALEHLYARRIVTPPQKALPRRLTGSGIECSSVRQRVSRCVAARPSLERTMRTSPDGSGGVLVPRALTLGTLPADSSERPDAARLEVALHQ